MSVRLKLLFRDQSHCTFQPQSITGVCSGRLSTRGSSTVYTSRTMPTALVPLPPGFIELTRLSHFFPLARSL
jgi:hypothetical protein